MKFKQIGFTLIVLSVLASCTTRNTSLDNPVSAEESSNWHVHGVEVIIPDSLTTTEINRFQPEVDIIWHGDWPGDRKEQVAKILQAGVEAGAETLMPENYHRPVVVEVTLIRFHSITPIARSWTGGVHKVSFSAQVVDQNTGEVLAGPSILEADEFAYGGSRAVQADAEGETMKIRITNRIAEVIAEWLGLVSEENKVTQGKIFALGH